MLRRSVLLISVTVLALISSYTVFAEWTRSREADLDGALRSIHFINESKGWAVGDNGLLVTTNDGGAKWETQVLEEVKESKSGEADLYIILWDVFFVNEKMGWISGDMFKGSGAILHTKDGGKTWSRQSSGSAYPLYAIYFLDEKNGWAVGENNTILGTQTGGSKWVPLATGKANAEVGGGDPGLWDVHFVNLKKGWVVGASGTIKMTEDGGKTWVTQASGIQGSDKSLMITDSNLSAVDFVNETTGWAVGEGGVILNTTDGGKTWTLQNSGVTEWLHGVDFVSETEGFATGEYGTILHTTDGGKTWKIENSGKQKGAPRDTFYTVAFPKPDVAYAAADWGLVLKYKPCE